MQQYINQLLEDLKMAQQSVPEPPNYALLHPEADVIKGLEGVLEWEYAEHHDWLYWTGLEKEIFPPVQQLNNQQIEAVIAGILALWKTFRVGAVFPETFPIAQRYELLVASWMDKFPCYHHGNMVMDWCSGTAPTCPFGEHCSCLQYWNDAEV